ncbi:hypothetical protein D044_4319B, partial [Vibrio parahaemolyticus EKP-026]
TVSSSRNIG